MRIPLEMGVQAAAAVPAHARVPLAGRAHGVPHARGGQRGGPHYSW